jgi:hypothetical protein
MWTGRLEDGPLTQERHPELSGADSLPLHRSHFRRKPAAAGLANCERGRLSRGYGRARSRHPNPRRFLLTPRYCPHERPREFDTFDRGPEATLWVGFGVQAKPSSK